MCERLRIALPSGELQDDVLEYLGNCGLSFAVESRRYLH